jgi:hypothetical protein
MPGFKAILVFTVLFPVAFAALSASIHAEDICSFDYVAADGLLASAFKELPRQALADKPETVQTMLRALPNVRRIFASERGYVALVGWAELPEDYSKFSDLQAERKLVTMAELGKRTTNADKEVSYKTDFSPPISLFLNVDYLDDFKPYRDVSMDVIATNRCLFSIKLSGARKPNDDSVWQGFHSDFERIRVLINDHEGPVAFSKGGRFFSPLGIVNVAIFAVAGATAGAMIAFGLTRRYEITPGKAARRYSLAIVLLCLFTLGVTGITAALIGTAFETYDGVLLIVLILAVHLNAYIRRSPMAVLAAVSLVLGLFVVGGIYMALGWRALPRPGEAAGIVIGLAMLVYAVAGTMSPITKPTAQSAPR